MFNFFFTRIIIFLPKLRITSLESSASDDWIAKEKERAQLKEQG